MKTLFALGVLLLLAACAAGPTTERLTGPRAPSPSFPPLQTETPNPRSEIRLGWAYEAYPDQGGAQMRDELARMRAAGLNSVWLGHNNPGDVDAAKLEPGLSFAVWYALEYEAGPRHEHAQAMADAVRRALDAARAAGLKVVLPIGYQIAMGSTWDRLHPEALRRTFDGQPLQLYSSPPTASPYSAIFRADTARYYEWIESEWVRPYRETIEMLSLSDEPQGGDYSAAAQAEFVRRYGKAGDALASDEQWKLGEFQAGVVADFAAWSARAWQALDPSVRTTISFHSGDARVRPGLPEIERLFSETPDNFIVTFDTYLHDDLPTKPTTDTERAELELFLTTLGQYSRVYHKPVALWTGANNWGLAQESPRPLGVGEAATNAQLLFDLPERAGGRVWGVYAWNYNVKQQGLYNSSAPTTYNPAALQTAVEGALLSLRGRTVEPAPLQAAIIAAPRELYTAIAQAHAADVPPPWFDTGATAALLRGRTAAVVTPGPMLDAAAEADVLICVAHRAFVTPEVLALLKRSADAGRIVLAYADIAQALDAPRQPWPPGWNKLPTHGGLYFVEP